VLLRVVAPFTSVASDLMPEGAHLALERVNLVFSSEDHVSTSSLRMLGWQLRRRA